MLKHFIIAFVAVAVFAGCNSNSTSENTTSSQPDSEEVHASNSGQIEMIAARFDNLDKPASEFISRIVADYLKMESALVAADNTAASKDAASLVDALNSFDKSHFTIDQKKAYDEIGHDLAELGGLIKSGDLDEQRTAFAQMSMAMHHLVKDFASGEQLYYAYCPMYRGGAYWLTNQQDIANPYYGDRMLACGEIKESIK